MILLLLLAAALGAAASAAPATAEPSTTVLAAKPAIAESPVPTAAAKPAVAEPSPLEPPAPAEPPPAVSETVVTDAEVQPLFAKPPLRTALEAFDADRWGEAAALLARSSLPEARYLRGVALVNAGRGAEAARALARLAGELPDLADHVSWWTGQALDLAGDRRAAAAAYAAVPPSSLLWPESRIALGKALEAHGDVAGALRAFDALAALGPPADLSKPDLAATALLLSGRLRASRADAPSREAARHDLVECWAGHPLAPESRDCRVRLGSLPPPGNAPPGVEDSLRRVEALLDLNRNGDALRDLERLAPRLPPPAREEPLGCRARFALGRAFRKERAYVKAMEALAPVVERCADPGLRVRALYLRASAAAVASPEDAIELFQRLAREYPNHALADDALISAADLTARAGHIAEARRLLADVAERYRGGDQRPEAMFRAAWLARRQGDVAGAIAGFAAIEAEYRDSDAYEHARAAYWRARLLAARGEPGDADAARAIWADLAARYPTDYYGLLSRTRLQEGGAACGARIDLPDPMAPAADAPFRYRAGPLASDPHFRAGLRLLRMGLLRAAGDELDAADRRLVAPGAASGHEPLLLLAELLDRAGEHRGAHNLLRTLGRAALRGRPEGAALRVWRIAYPPAWRAEVARWAPRAGVPVDLLQALMREESALDPLVVSPAGAVGLTQLMPTTAREVARRHKLGRPSHADLTKPSLNIRLGAAYLGELLRRFGGSPALALAAYNAGDGALRRWLGERGGLDLDEFVEEIPVSETRGYVKRVLRSYAAYRYLYGNRVERTAVLERKSPVAAAR